MILSPLSKMARARKQEEDPYSLYIHKRNQVDMMRDRGYSISRREEDSLSSFQRFTEAMADGYDPLAGVLYRPVQRGQSIYLLYFRDPKELATMYQLHEADRTLKFIFIHYGTVKNVPGPNELPSFRFQYLPYDFFAINATRHFLSNKNRILTPWEQKLFLARTHMQITELPGISIDDAIVQYFDVPLGSIIQRTVRVLLPSYIREYPLYVVVRNIPIIYSTSELREGEDADLEEPDGEEPEGIEHDVYE